MTSNENEQSQPQRFAELARALECDEDEARWEARLKNVAKGKPGKSSDPADGTP